MCVSGAHANLGPSNYDADILTVCHAIVFTDQMIWPVARASSSGCDYLGFKLLLQMLQRSPGLLFFLSVGDRWRIVEFRMFELIWRNVAIVERQLMVLASTILTFYLPMLCSNYNNVRLPRTWVGMFVRRLATNLLPLFYCICKDLRCTLLIVRWRVTFCVCPGHKTLLCPVIRSLSLSLTVSLVKSASSRHVTSTSSWFVSTSS